jgi:hypothetical protein
LLHGFRYHSNFIKVALDLNCSLSEMFIRRSNVKGILSVFMLLNYFCRGWGKKCNWYVRVCTLCSVAMVCVLRNFLVKKEIKWFSSKPMTVIFFPVIRRK